MLTLAACSTTPIAEAPAEETAAIETAPAVSTEPTTTILISIDGFRPDYLDRGATPTLSELAANGSWGPMQPSFPSKTFPNHYAIVTGLRPDHNGIINNTMEDPDMPGAIFMLSNPVVASNPEWWEEGRPLWVSASEQGIPSATMFWPGSDFEIHGERPTEFMNFDQALTDFARVDVVLGWMDVPAEERPVFATLYFDIVDTAGHRYGPDDSRTTSATAQVDAAISRLIEGLEALGLRDNTNLVIVSDHGMAPVSDEQIMHVDDMVDTSLTHIVWGGEFMGLSPLPGHEAEVEEALLGHREHGECWRKGELPERFEYGSNPRVPEIVCLADTGWRYEAPNVRVWRGSGGSHGFDPADPLMNAVFIANGPDIASGVELDLFDNVSVYPLLAELTGIEPAENDGDITQLEAALK